jgi:hypothetical protein
MFKSTAILASLVVFAVAGTAYAGNSAGGAKSSSLSLRMVGTASAATAASSGARYGDTITFDVSTAATDRPFVGLACSQNGATVFGQSAGFFAGYPWPSQQTFTLSSQYWTGGPADCTATLYYFDGKRLRDLASLSFSVAA